MTGTKERKTKMKSERPSSDDDVLGMYFREISRIPLLSREDEEKTAIAAAQGDKIARDKLVRGNLRFVVNVAKKYQGQGIPLGDLINEGNIGLINAVEKFDVSRGYHFISYAVWWIRQSIVKALYDKSRLIRLPVNRASDLIHIEKCKKMLAGTCSTENEIQEIAQMLNIGENYVADIMAISREVVSLEKMVDTDRGASTLGNFVVDTRYDIPEDAALKKSLEADIEEILSTLDKKEAEVIRCRYGLSKRVPMSLQELGEHFNLSKERIRQIEEKALLRLKHLSRKAKLKDYVA